MTRETRHINLSDLRGASAWERLLEEVHTTKTPAILCDGDKEVAELRPLARAACCHPRQPSTKSDDVAFWFAAGSWKDLADGEQLKRDLTAANGSDRPPVAL